MRLLTNHTRFCRTIREVDGIRCIEMELGESDASDAKAVPRKARIRAYGRTVIMSIALSNPLIGSTNAGHPSRPQGPLRGRWPDGHHQKLYFAAATPSPHRHVIWRWARGGTANSIDD
jgi:hypothetical protein